LLCAVGAAHLVERLTVRPVWVIPRVIVPVVVELGIGGGLFGGVDGLAVVADEGEEGIGVAGFDEGVDVGEGLGG
jgi:hypothetical protein